MEELSIPLTVNALVKHHGPTTLKLKTVLLAPILVLDFAIIMVLPLQPVPLVPVTNTGEVLTADLALPRMPLAVTEEQ